MGVTIFTTAGSGTWTCPNEVQWVTAECWGGGGAGGGNSQASRDGGGGGGGAAYARSTVPTVPGTLYNYVVGIGGTGKANATGTMGSASWFSSPATIRAWGGSGGAPGGGATGGFGGFPGNASSSLGQFTFSGGRGGRARTSTTGRGGSGGSSGGSAAAGNNGVDLGTTGTPVVTNPPYEGGEGGGGATATSGPGFAGSRGGGGGGSSEGTALRPANGATGSVRLTWNETMLMVWDGIEFEECMGVSTGSSATSASDDFNRGDNADLGTYWTPIKNTCLISSSAARGATHDSACVEYYNNFTPTNDQWSQVTIHTGSLGTYRAIGPVVRANSGYTYYYSVYEPYDGHLYVGKALPAITEWDAGSIAFVENDVLRLEVSGNLLTTKRNGATVDSRSDAGSSIASGYAGISVYSDTNASVDDWSGGNLLASASKVTMSDNFDRANQSITASGDWEDVENNSYIVNNQVKDIYTVQNDNCARWKGAGSGTLSANHYSQVYVYSASAQAYEDAGPTVRVKDVNNYYCISCMVTSIEVFIKRGGSWSTGSYASYAVSPQVYNGDIVYGSATTEGTNVRIIVKLNGAEVINFIDPGAGIMSGGIGVHSYWNGAGGNGIRLDNWSGGDV